MHVKVARRRFQSRTDTSSFGWVYCGSHNFSAAAWGRPIHSSGMNLNEDSRTKSVLGSRLHICNYEFGIVFVVPPSENKHYADKSHSNLDDITLPFVIPAPRYRHMDTPATKFAMSNLARQEREKNVEPADVEEEIPDEEEEVLEVPDVIIEKEDDKAYAEKLWGLS
ncbi:putative tyrosyl-DNA phosphodiesterase I [Helianthus annuus]|nr:putative tyrosyl-DNA phosphodiesterase I [Helianthus annuus]